MSRGTDTAVAARDRVVEERERLATALHDHVIQDLFALGLSVQGLRSRLDPAVSAVVSRADLDQRLAAVSNRIDKVIAELRSTVFALQYTQVVDEVDLHTQLILLVTDALSGTGIGLDARVDPIPVADVSPDIAASLLTVAREAVSNAVRHSRADMVRVTGGWAGRQLLLTVADDGVGIADTVRRGGLMRMDHLAERVGGRLEIVSAPGDGTSVTWSVPVGSSVRQPI